MSPQELQAALDNAVARLRGGRAHDAVSLLERTVQASPRTAEAHRLLGLARRDIRDIAGAEAALRQAVALDRKNSEALTALGELQATLGKTAEAEKSFRAALAVNRRGAAAAQGLAALMAAQERFAEALQATTPLYEGTTDPALAAQHAATLKALGRKTEALAAYTRAAVLQPGAVAEHNIAAAFADLNRYPEAEAATRRAFAQGGRAPETWLVHAHALQGQDRLDEAEAAYREALKARPAYPKAHQDLAQLIWMRTEDAAAATALLDHAIAASPGEGSLAVLRANLLAHTGEDLRAFEGMAEAARRQPDELRFQIAASQHAVKAGLPEDALAHAERALILAPGQYRSLATLCEANLAAGRADAAASGAEVLRRMQPEDQHVLALQAAAWRLLGDARYRALYDYAAFVRGWRIETPKGWAHLDAYLADLTVGLAAMHTVRTHPVGQSLRHGSQTNQSLLNADNPAIRAFPEAIDGPIRAHIAAIGQGKDPLRSRNRGGYSIAGIWSVRLRPGGFHIDHVHPEGWLSSACYIALPHAVDGEGRQGWIRFGEPGIATRPPLPAEHYVKPEPGLLVLFPSYMWHGTVPFEGDDRRLTVAFDLVPDKARRG